MTTTPTPDPKRTSKTAAAAILAAALAVPAEGLRQFAYYDPPGVLSVCYGHTGKDVFAQRKYSFEQCRAFLDVDMNNAVNAVDRCVPEAPPSVLAAFADAAYNLGPKIACSPAHSTAAVFLSLHAWKEACAQLSRWDKAVIAGVSVTLPGLTRRRAAEREVCEAGL